MKWGLHCWTLIFLWSRYAAKDEGQISGSTKNKQIEKDLRTQCYEHYHVVSTWWPNQILNLNDLSNTTRLFDEFLSLF